MYVPDSPTDRGQPTPPRIIPVDSAMKETAVVARAQWQEGG
jgi:hypothetical protein